ncbi:hypothetical protein J4477_04810 [Candidatus Pacearchaeota archaeon]|nr:hypothetical protein [Candidatus Pacearchaeota archaeon]
MKRAKNIAAISVILVLSLILVSAVSTFGNLFQPEINNQVCENECMVPDNLGDNETEIIFPSFGNETSLQDILLGLGYVVNTSDNQSQAQVWNTTYDAVLEVKFLGKVAAANQAFGYYLDHDTSNFTVIFEAGDHPNYTAQIANVNDAFQINIPAGSSFGFAMDSFYGGSVIYYTENEFNPENKDHALVYDFCNEFVVAFENSGGEPDYQDIIVSVKLLECNQQCIDKDNDSVCDNIDECLDSQGEVDENGCDVDQFCSFFGCGYDCLYADWKDDEEGRAYDCTVVIKHQNGIPVGPECVAVRQFCPA